MKITQTRAALYLLCVSRVGYFQAPGLIAFIEEWQRAVSHHEGRVGIEGFIRWTRRYRRRQAYDLLRRFRTAFPELGPEGNPEALMGPLLERLAAEAVEPDR